MSPRGPKQPVAGTRNLYRTVIHLREEEDKALDDYAQRKGLSRSEVCRRALRRFLKIPD
jgi:hypothetical protein